MLHRWNESPGDSAFLGRNPGSLAMRFAFAGVLLRAGRRGDAQREYSACGLWRRTWKEWTNWGDNSPHRSWHPDHAA
ncbi:MAG: hypothetical protein MRJ92_05790 [Nitrospira sp.]|nr:hypothetical protein [Nitrospira sp.]